MNKVCVVTGGTRGIGLATVIAFAKAGYQVVLYGSRKESVEKALSDLKEQNLEAEGKWTDLTDEAAVMKDFEEIKSQYGSLDVVICNAGISDSTPFTDYSVDLFKKVMDLNVVAPYVCAHAAAGIMKEQRNGVILITSSMVAKNGQPSGVAYPVSKFAVNGMVTSLARELGPFGIRVNAAAPGITMTDMVKALPEAMINPMIHAIPLRRIGLPEDIANAFLFLASDQASYITGAILPVDGAMAV
ncbi:MAG: SDR family oxidoreductase [Ileibacterium sp.]|nr:SDR family oxidoreductase [Ileibacterium sp.]